MFSISAGIIETLSFTLLNEVFHLPYMPCYLVALILSVLWNFTLNREFTFTQYNKDCCLTQLELRFSGSVTVKINGEVLFPNTVSYIEGKRANFYINQAGGYSNQAKRSKAYVIYANGKVHPKAGAKIQPGCEIVIPSKPERAPMTVAQWVSITSASASLASVAATITTLIIRVK